MCLLHRHLLRGEGRGEIGVLVSEHLDAADAAGGDDAMAVACSGAKHLDGVTRHIDGQRLLYRARCNMGFGHLVVPAVVAEEVLLECPIEYLEKLIGHLDLVVYVNTETLELVGLIAGPDAEHQAAPRQSIGAGDLRDQPHWLVERHYDNRRAEADVPSTIWPPGVAFLRS